jgi:hypothetical protein
MGSLSLLKCRELRGESGSGVATIFEFRKLLVAVFAVPISRVGNDILVERATLYRFFSSPADVYAARSRCVDYEAEERLSSLCSTALLYLMHEIVHHVEPPSRT